MVFGRSWAILLVAGAVCLAYLNSFRGEFILDDMPHIVDTPFIRHLWSLSDTLAQTSRPLVRLSLAVNYAISRLQPWSYHAFNVAVHVLAALALFGVARRTLVRAGRREAALGLSTAVTLLWALHPLQTECATYVIQRAESMMGLFYLLTLYSFIRGVDSRRAGVWFAASIAACALGMACKPVMATAPLAVLLYDRTFVAGSARVALRKRKLLYLGLAATWLLLAALLTVKEESRPSAGFNVAEVAPWEYVLTEPAVVLHYLRLSLWPSNLCFDYEWPLVTSVRAAVPSSAAVAVLLAATGWALARRPRLGFLGAWFFLNLMPTSSFIPVTDPAAEHRVYLALAGVVALVVIGGDAALRATLDRKAVPARARKLVGVGLVLLTSVALGAATARRNTDYWSKVGMWRKVIAQRPENSRAHNNLGAILYRSGEKEEALALYRKALDLRPEQAEAHYNLGIALAAEGRDDEALPHLEAAVRFDPSKALWHNDLGLMLARHGHVEEAIEQFSQALAIRPSYADAHNNIGVALANQGKIAEARAHFAEALRLEPDNVHAKENLARTVLP